MVPAYLTLASYCDISFPLAIVFPLLSSTAIKYIPSAKPGIFNETTGWATSSVMITSPMLFVILTLQG